MAVASEHSPAPGTQEAPLRSLTMCNPSSLFSLETPHDKKVIPEESSAITLPPLPSKGTGVLLQEQPVACAHMHAFRHTGNSLLRVLGTQAWTSVFSLQCPRHEASTWWSALSGQAPGSRCILSFGRIRLFLNLVHLYLPQRSLPDPDR